MCAVHIALHGLWGQVGAVGFSQCTVNELLALCWDAVVGGFSEKKQQQKGSFFLEHPLYGALQSTHALDDITEKMSHLSILYWTLRCYINTVLLLLLSSCKMLSNRMRCKQIHTGYMDRNQKQCHRDVAKMAALSGANPQ